VDIFRELGDRGLKKISSGRVADAFIRRPGRSLPGRPVSPGEQVGARV
jgi:hypothetical protein